MKNAVNFEKEILIEPVSPIFIGSGEKIGKFETVVEGGKTYILNFEKLMENEKFVAFFAANVDKILDAASKDKVLLEIFKRLNLNVADYSYAWFKTITDKNGKPKTLQISRFIRSGGRYYIPGSSLKGALRTMIIKSAPEFAAMFKNSFKLEGDELKRKVKTIEEELFGEPQNSPFKLLRITDSTFIESSHVKFKMVQVVHLEQPKQKIPQLFEVWLPNSRGAQASKVKCNIAFLSSNLDKIKNTPQLLNYFRGLFANESSFVNEMKKAARIIIDMEKKKASMIRDEGIRKVLTHFYNELTNLNEKIENGFLVRIGGHTSFYSKTGYTEFLGEREVGKLKRFFGYSKVTINNFPITTKVVKLSESPNDIMPLGWIKVQLVD